MRLTSFIRDPIHGDVALSALEMRVIDTAQFQRLRWVRQLGTAYLVYPSAIHTRFDHAIGVCALATKILEGIARAPGEECKLGAGDLQLVRLAGLLHDMGHAPFSQALAHRPFMGSAHSPTPGDALGGGEIMRCISSYDSGLATEVLAALSFGAQGSPRPLASPYVADVIGGPISADLLDYLERDSYFTGIRQGYDKRILASFQISADGRMVLKMSEGPFFKADLASEVLGILRMRYVLMERVLLHRTVLAGAAMVSRMAESIWEENPERLRALYTFRDQDLISAAVSTGGVAGDLAEGLLARRLHKPVYRIEAPAPFDARGLEQALRHVHSDVGARRQLERAIEQGSGLPEGSVIMYCPARPMDVGTGVRVLLPGGRVVALREVEDAMTAVELRALEQKLLSLWSMYVFLGASQVHKAESVVRLCHEFLGGFLAVSDKVRISFDAETEATGYELIVKAGPVGYTGPGGEYVVPRSTLEILKKNAVPFTLRDSR